MSNKPPATVLIISLESSLEAALVFACGWRGNAEWAGTVSRLARNLTISTAEKNRVHERPVDSRFRSRHNDILHIIFNSLNPGEEKWIQTRDTVDATIKDVEIIVLCQKVEVSAV